MNRLHLFKILFIAFILVVLFYIPQANAAPDSFKLCPAGSKAVLYADIKAFSGFVQKNKMAADFKNQIEKIKKLSSVDILKDINSFTAVLADIASYRSGKNPAGVFIFEGYFRSGEIGKKLSEAGIKLEMVESQKLFKLDEDVYLSIPSDKFLIYGNLSEIKIVNSLISSKEKNNIESDSFFNAQLSAPESKDRTLMLIVKLPEALSKFATAMAKTNKEQAVFSELEGFYAAASERDILFKYVYLTKDAAGRGEASAKEFMEKGFSQIAYNARRLTESIPDKTKVAVERFNFVKNGLLLMLKLKESMAIERNEKSVYIKFGLDKSEKETGDFIRSLFDAFVTLLVREEVKTSPASVDSENK